MVGDTNIMDKPKCCSRCDDVKPIENFIKNRNICKECANTRKKEQYKAAIVDETPKECNICNQTKLTSSFIKNRKICKDCNNEKRQTKYHTDEEYRLKAISQSLIFKHTKVIERNQLKLEEIGEGNKKCSICFTIKESCNFRYNRLKCRHCERDDPLDKFKRNIRSRIWCALNNNKNMHTIVYLGCSSQEYLQWILTYDENYNLENHGNIWHIDHIIPISRFNLEDKAEQLLAFNWRNTMPLLAKENLSKNNKIITSQIDRHLLYLKTYHENNNIELPQIYIDLFAKHLVDGNPLKQSLPL